MLLNKDTVAAKILSNLKGSEERRPDTESAPSEKQDATDVRTAGFHAACEDMLHAFKSQSPNDLFTALKSFMDQYQALSPDDEGGDV